MLSAPPSFMFEFFTPKDIQRDLPTSDFLQLPETNTLVCGNSHVSFRGSTLRDMSSDTTKFAQNSTPSNSKI